MQSGKKSVVGNYPRILTSLWHIYKLICLTKIRYDSSALQFSGERLTESGFFSLNHRIIPWFKPICISKDIIPQNYENYSSLASKISKYTSPIVREQTDTLTDLLTSYCFRGKLVELIYKVGYTDLKWKVCISRNL